MNITQVYLTLDYDTSDQDKRVEYQIGNTYIQLFIEECLRKNKHDFGAFNRLVFSEGGDVAGDFHIVGNSAFDVAVDDTYSKLETLKTNREIHNYYISKFLEGFKKLDSHFKSSFVEYLTPLLEEKYKKELYYEKKIASKVIKGHKVQVDSRYEREFFKLFVNIYHKKQLVKSEIIFQCEPDMFITKYEVNKVFIEEEKITILNKIRETSIEYDLGGVL